MLKRLTTDIRFPTPKGIDKISMESAHPGGGAPNTGGVGKICDFRPKIAINCPLLWFTPLTVLCQHFDILVKSVGIIYSCKNVP